MIPIGIVYVLSLGDVVGLDFDRQSGDALDDVCGIVGQDHCLHTAGEDLADRVDLETGCMRARQDKPATPGVQRFTFAFSLSSEMIASLALIPTMTTSPSSM